MKKIAFAVLVSAGSLGAFADLGYLDFLIAPEDPALQDFSYARIGVAGEGVAEGTYLNLKGTTSSWLANDAGAATLQNLAWFGEDESYRNYSYFIELYDDDFTRLWSDDTVSYGDLEKGGHVLGSDLMNTTTPWTVTTFSVPEPSSALLVLLGVGLLALRRRSARSAAPTGVCLAVLLACGMAFGAANNTLISFSTKGPDAYGDGSVVRDGECYALVWVKDGATFAGIAADGTAVDPSTSAVLLSAPVAKDGRCPAVVFELDASLAKRHEGGSFEVYLLDTRDAKGRVRGVGANGRVLAVNGYGPAGTASADGAAAAGGTVAVIAQSKLPKDAPKPRITAMRIIGGNAYLTVSGTLPCLQYKPMRVNLDGAAAGEESGAPVDGAAAGEDVILVMPAKGKSGFFKVGRH